MVISLPLPHPPLPASAWPLHGLHTSALGSAFPKPPPASVPLAAFLMPPWVKCSCRYQRVPIPPPTALWAFHLTLGPTPGPHSCNYPWPSPIVSFSLCCSVRRHALVSASTENSFLIFLRLLQLPAHSSPSFHRADFPFPSAVQRLSQHPLKLLASEPRCPACGQTQV